VTTGFREAAERRVAELEQRDRDRQVAREAKAAEQQAGQAADRERRQHAQRQQADQHAAEARSRLARRFGISAQRVVLGAEYRLFLIPHRDLAVAYRHEPTPHHPGGGTPRWPVDRMPQDSSWEQQSRLQRVLNVGVDPPLLVRGDQIHTHTLEVDRLLVDPAVHDLTNLTGATA
jgi:hypothetical protein